MIKIWLGQHGFVLMQTLKRMLYSPVTSLFSILAIGIALSLPVGVYVFLENLRAFSGQSSTTPQMSLFLKFDTNARDIDNIRHRLNSYDEIVHFDFVSKDQALQALQQNSGLGDVIRSLGRNPLPDAFVVDVQGESAAILERMRTVMQSWAEVEHVQFDSVWAERLNAILKLGRAIVLMLFTLLSIAVIAVMFNIIRLQLLGKRDEIEVSRLIGATDSFIRRPFLYFGAIQGLTGGMVALLVVTLVLQFMNTELETLAELYAWDVHLSHLSITDSISLLLFATWLGWLGARLAIAGYLYQIEN